MSKLNGFKISETLYSTPSTNVFRAIRESDQCPVILRTCDEKASSSQHSRLSSSAEILRGFDHPNIAKVIDIIDHSGQPWLIMADSHSIDLAQYLDALENKQLPLDVFLNIAVQLAEALSVIHHAHVIHKDLHPGNIVINPETQNIEIIDFGLASLLSREQPALAPPENLEGVISYISPEQTGRMNRSLDYRSDFYTLGITLYQLLTGELPFVADDAIGLVHAHIARVQKPVSQARPDIPDAVSDIIDKLMHKTAEERYQSAMGLKQDLEICRRHVVAGNAIPPFTLGLHDISDRFQVPQVLYGREQEVNQLMDSFYKAAQGQPQLLAVEGFAGIGKSALIHEVHKPIAAHSGIFTSGKFDQFQKNTPYSALKQAFSDWIQHALSLKESALNDLRAQLNKALGTNARVLIDFMDIFEVLLGDLAPLPVLGAQETQNRFHLVLQRFIQQITQQRPLVIFIDDLQWADRGTLNLLPQLMSAGLDDKSSQELNQEKNTENADQMACRLLLLVAYRDNEVDESHPAMQTLKQIKTEYQSANTLTLAPLKVKQINQLLVDALHQTPLATHPLAELLEHKTGGNPFFINEFLKTLYSEKLLNFDLSQQRWVWSLEAIKAQAITNNVVELMLGKMQQLPTVTQHMLQLASCIGSLFDLQTLSIISEQSMPDTMRKLWPALKQGLLLQEGGDWLLGIVKTASASHNYNESSASEPNEQDQQVKSHLSTRMSPLVPHCRFLHDRMLQAAYQSLSEGHRQQTHLNIGRLLYKHTDAELFENQLFSIIEQLNQGRSLIESESEKLELAQLNLQAAEKAKQASAWETALRYARIGASLLPENSWVIEYKLSYELNLVQIECEFLTFNFDVAKALAEHLLQQARTPLEHAQICLLLASQLLSGNVDYCIEKGLMGLRHCNIQVPNIAEIDDTLIEKEHQSLKVLLAKNDWEDQISTSTNKAISTEASLAYRLCSQLAGLSQIAGKPRLLSYIVIKGMHSILENNLSEHAIMIYTAYSAFLAKQGDYFEAKKISSTTLKLIERFPLCPDLPFVYMVLGSLVWIYNHPLKQAIEMQFKAHETGYEYGDISRGVFAGYSNAIINVFAQGLPFNQLKIHLNKLSILAQKYNVRVSAGSYYTRLIDTLTQTGSENTLHPASFDSDEWQQIQNCVLKPFIEHLRLQWFFWSDQNENAWQAVRDADFSLELMSGFITPLEHRFITALLACKQFQHTENPNDENYLQAIQASLDELSLLNTLCPENFEHKLLLLQAEQGRYQDQSIEALAPLYEAAIESASNNEFLQYEALANELYGEFLLVKKRTRFALPYIHDALNLYRHWGCTVKVKNLTARYQALFQSEAPQITSQTSPQTSLLSTKYSSLQTRTLNRSMTQTQTSSQEGLDLSSLMKSAQAISGELALKGLVSKVMLAILENSGAQNAALILESPTGAIIQAQIKAQNDRDLYNNSLEARPLDNATDLPVSLISYVLRTNTEQVLQEPSSNIHSSANDAFIEDPYLQMYQPKSVLCIPVSYREKLIGALYLENTLSHKAFPQERFDIIKMLLAQAAISFENARLFNEVTELNVGLEEKVKQRTRELDQSNQELDKSNQELNHAVIQLKASNKELETFSYSVSHDLRAPLRTIKGFSEILIEDYLDELDADAQMMLKKVMRGADNMGELINGLLDLSRMQRQELVRQQVNLSDMANYIVSDMRTNDPQRQVKVEIEADIQVQGDQRMLQSVIENLLNNAWKYSSKTENAEIAFATLARQKDQEQTTYFVKDNGAGFNMKYIDKLFGTFQRLHTEDDFAGTGVGLATVKRIIEKHGGKIWAEAEVNEGATFYFTLG